ncbi:MAG: HAMP domain-containing histidine kinase [Glycomyces artemisiae]|uniref:histidine kinase n=1 Tax=Glycomyces artemisiae TaxID=1076443 RepID=A0A850CD15_9ACTN|nr:HAMP domain-containing histidine kinase [Glycomyces artemisiae]
MDRKPGLSVRLRLTISYAAFLVVAGSLLLAIVWLFLLRYVPMEAITVRGTRGPDGVVGPGLFIPGRIDLWRAFAPKALASLVFLLLLGLGGGWFLAGRMLAPLTRITEATREAAGGALGHRIRLPGRQDEFRELADSFDSMLAQLESHVAEQQRFAANASHELRTPLAITQTMLEVARSDPSRDPAELIERLHLMNARAIDLTEALLLLSRSDQRAFAKEHVDLSLAAEEAAESLLELAERRGVSVEVAGDAAPASGSYSLLLQLAVNLLHNAIVHNLPEGGEVRVATGVDAGDAYLTVENTGRILAPQLVATLTERFQRGSGRTRTDHVGIGLGLAIADSIARAHDGSLTLAPRAGGGLAATVRLPADRP